MKVDLKFIGANIRKLRRQRNWSIAVLADKIGMSQVPLGRIERGVNAPSASVIYRLSKALEVSIDTMFAESEDDFRSFQHESNRDPFPVSIEKKAEEVPVRIKTMARELVDAFWALEDICNAQKRAKIPLFIPFEPTQKGMEALAVSVRHYAGIKHGVAFDYFELFENQGFRVIIVPMIKDIHSFSYYDPLYQNAFFFLNARHNSERQLFRLAYELGKILIFTGVINRNEKLFPKEVETTPSNEKPFTSIRAANRFAATFLMPANSVRDTVNQLGIQKKRWSYELLLRIKHRFGISAETFLYRLKELELIDSDLVEPLKKKIHDHYGKTDFAEPDFSRRVLTPNGRLWDLFLTAKEIKESREEVMEIEKVLNRWRVVKK